MDCFITVNRFVYHQDNNGVEYALFHKEKYRYFSAIVFHCTTFEKNEIEKFGILIFDVLFLRDLRIISEGESMSIQ